MADYFPFIVVLGLVVAGLLILRLLRKPAETVDPANPVVGGGNKNDSKNTQKK